ncbi:E3 ubiquitin-protein ligase SINA-like 3 [Triticum aestivum]|uniref:E3 ubiquitin-protein ligase SINA-like 3 n=1 Tax=Triticum aestivum TaxID=4565 RepID=UPI001D0196A1|nr:E3 ubiquitin-protein ligase SINA-like 3 [Triticum aestivum]
MECLMESVTVACSNANYGCAQKLTYYQKEEHEKACPSAPCFCAASSCSFAGPTDAILEHCASQHKWPCTTIKYSEDVELCLEPGLHFLCTKDREIFLLNVALEPCGHAISVVCIQPKAINSKFKCRMSYGSFLNDYYQRSVYKIRSSSLSDGLPKGYNLILPKDEITDDGKGTLLTFSIDDPNPKVKVCEPICLKPFIRVMDQNCSGFQMLFLTSEMGYVDRTSERTKLHIRAPSYLSISTKPHICSTLLRAPPAGAACPAAATYSLRV